MKKNLFAFVAAMLLFAVVACNKPGGGDSGGGSNSGSSNSGGDSGGGSNSGGGETYCYTCTLTTTMTILGEKRPPSTKTTEVCNITAQGASDLERNGTHTITSGESSSSSSVTTCTRK
jgi:hypothetical protein